MLSFRLLVFSLWSIIVLLSKTYHFRVQNLQSKMSRYDIRSYPSQSSPEYPFIAILVDSKSKQPFCTGTLIEELIVLTAAQCIETVDTFGTRRRRQLRSFSVGLACADPSRTPCQKHRVDYAVIHDRHVSLGNLNDLAMLKIRKDPFESGRGAVPKPHPLIFSGWHQAVDLRDCLALGYGYPSKRDRGRMLPREIQPRILAQAPKGSSQSSLRSVKVSMAYSRGVCPPGLFLDRLKFLCSNQQSDREGSFAMFFLADRGGPLLCRCNNVNANVNVQDHERSMIIVGQFTWQPPMEQSSKQPPPPPAAVFTNLSYHFGWIQENIPLLKALKHRDTLIKYIEYPPPSSNNGQNSKLKRLKN